MSNYHKLYTPNDSAVVFIDHQPQMTFGVANIDRATLINNVTLLAKVAKEYSVPAVLTAVETESFSGTSESRARRCASRASTHRHMPPARLRSIGASTLRRNRIGS
jgi:nicotinamidase-related amidase